MLTQNVQGGTVQVPQKKYTSKVFILERPARFIRNNVQFGYQRDGVIFFFSLDHQARLHYIAHRCLMHKGPTVNAFGGTSTKNKARHRARH